AWALTEVRERKYHGTVLLDPAAPQIALRGIDEGTLREDPRVCRALKEVFARGRAPLPDQVLRRPAVVAVGRLSLHLDGNRLVRRGDGSYAPKLWGDRPGAGWRLPFAPQKPAGPPRGPRGARPRRPPALAHS